MRVHPIDRDTRNTDDWTERDSPERRMLLARALTRSSTDLNFVKEIHDKLPKNIPPGIDYVKMSEAVHKMGTPGLEKVTGYFDVKNSFGNKGEYDFKQKSSLYEKFGNFNYGFFVGKRYGLTIAKFAAGTASIIAGTSPLGPKFGLIDWMKYFTDPNFGDQPPDSADIEIGSEVSRLLLEHQNQESKDSLDTKQRVEAPKNDSEEKLPILNTNK